MLISIALQIDSILRESIGSKVQLQGPHSRRAVAFKAALILQLECQILARIKMKMFARERVLVAMKVH